MGFFEFPARPAPADAPDPAPPYDIPRPAPWTAGVVPIELLVARSDEAAVVASRIAAFPDGFELTLDSYLHTSVSIRRRRYLHGPMCEHDFEPGAPPPASMLRFGLVWPDGGQATNLDRWAPPRPDAPEPAHGFEEHGGGGSDTRYSQQYWCWPLPAQGTLTFVVEWPEFGIPETSASVDAAPFAEAASRARPVWEEDAGGPSHVNRFAIMRAMREQGFAG